MSALLWLAPLVLPLAAAVAALLVGRGRAWLAVLAPLPALALALLAAPGPPPDLTWVMLDVRLDLDPVGRLLLATTALVWLAGGTAARGITAASGPTTALWLVTLTGNVGLVMAADVVTLYSLFALMTFAAYGLVVHDGTRASRRAGRVYMAMAVLGEAMLLSGLMLAVGAAGDTGTHQVATALADADLRGPIIALVSAGFAVKAGIVPLHGWLPLAHPAAPVAASAALSGAMIKAGLVGWLAVLPLGAVALPGWATTFVVVGLVTAVTGVALGAAQTRPKVLLAYSSVSQMGLIATVVGVGLAVPAVAPLAFAGAAVAALHHGVAKAALFLGVGVHGRLSGTRGRRLLLAGTALAGLALAGAPLTSGWVAKGVMKSAVDALADPWAGRLTFALSLVAVGTTGLMARLLVLLARPGHGGAEGAGADEEGSGATTVPTVDRWLVTAWAALLGAVVVASWVLPRWLLGPVGSPTLGWSTALDALWPVAVGVVASLVVARWAARRPARERPAVPPGDVVVLVEALGPPLTRLVGHGEDASARVARVTRVVAGALQRLVHPEEGFARVDRMMTRWRAAGALLVLLGLALALALVFGSPSGTAAGWPG